VCVTRNRLSAGSCPAALDDGPGTGRCIAHKQAHAGDRGELHEGSRVAVRTARRLAAEALTVNDASKRVRASADDAGARASHGPDHEGPARYEHGSIILTTNRGIASWDEIFEDTTVAAAILDRLLHHATVLQIDGDSYRMRTHRARLQNLRSGLNAPEQSG